MTAAFAGYGQAVCRHGKTVLKGAAITLGICALFTEALYGFAAFDNSSKTGFLKDALASGDEFVYYDYARYKIECTGPGRVNAFELDRNGMPTDNALIGHPIGAVSRWFKGFVPAAGCN